MTYTKKKYFGLTLLLLATGFITAFAQMVSEKDFRTNAHPRVFVTAADKVAILRKIETVGWVKEIYNNLKAEVDFIAAIHQEQPGYVISRMQMHWEPDKRYTRFYTDGNFITRREGNAKYPTVRVTYGRAASNSVPLMPLDKIIPYGDGTLTKPATTQMGVVKIVDTTVSMLSHLGQTQTYDTVPFTKTGLGTETVNRAFIHLAWKSSILYYLTCEKKYAKLSADILWNFVRGAAQQEQVNPDWELSKDKNCINGYLSYETLGDTRHFATLPLAYDMIYDYLHYEYFNSDQFNNGIEGEMWAPAHTEGKAWALECFEIMFKRLIENKLNRGGGLLGNWNMNEQQSAMLYALALDEDSTYADGKGRAYYVNKLVYGPTTTTHGAYMDVLRANISPQTGLWPEAPAGYGQGSMAQLVRFGFIYYKNGLDFLSKDPLLTKAACAMRQMLFPNGFVTNFGDASYSTIDTAPVELMLAYSREKNDKEGEKRFAEIMSYANTRNLNDEFYLPLFFYLPEVPPVENIRRLGRTSYSSIYSLVFGRNNADDAKDALAFTLMGFGKRTGHRQPNGMNIELYGRGHVLAPDQGIGADYWSRDTHEYKINVAGHNTVSPNGKGAANNMPQDLEILYAEPFVRDGEEPETSVSKNVQFVEAANHFYTKEIKAEQRRMLSIVRTSPQTGYFIDIFHSIVKDGENRYHDYIYHNMGTGAEILAADGSQIEMDDISLDTLSGKGYSFFETLGSLVTDKDFSVKFHLGTDDTHMHMFMLGAKNRTVYRLNSPNNHRYYIPSLRQHTVPAMLIRQEGGAWDIPFVAVYEPYGNGSEACLKAVKEDKTTYQPGIAKLTVEHKQTGRKDYIIHTDDIDKEAVYQGIHFKGIYTVVSLNGGKVPKMIYVGCGKSFKMKGLEVTSVSGEPFNACFEWNNIGYSYRSDKELSVRGKYVCCEESKVNDSVFKNGEK